MAIPRASSERRTFREIAENTKYSPVVIRLENVSGQSFQRRSMKVAFDLLLFYRPHPGKQEGASDSGISRERNIRLRLNFFYRE